jgi:tight adherence protein B
MSARAWRRTGAAAVLLALVLPAASASAVTGRITEIESVNGTLRLVFSADSLPTGVKLDPKSVTLSINGTRIASQASVVTGAAVRRNAELVIDTSGSMKGEGIAGAKDAALAFVDAVPKDVRVGLVTFSDTAAVRVAPSLDRGALRTAINALQPTGETALYDGTLLGLRQLGPSGVRTMLVLSDGADTVSKAKLPAVLAAAKSSNATVDTVAFKTNEGQGAVLKQIADAGRGRAIAASKAGDIGAAFREAARAISNQLVIIADVPPGISGLVTVAVSAKAGATTLTDESATTIELKAVPVDTGPRPAVVSAGRFANKSLLWWALGAIFVGLALLFVLGFGTMTPDRKTGRMRRRLSLYTLTGRAQPEAREPTALGDSGVAHSAVDLAGRMVSQRDLEQALALRLERAGSAFKPAEWLLIHASITIGGALLMLLLTAGRIVPTLLGFFLGLLAPYFWLSFRASRRTSAFMAQLPDTLQLIAGSLSAGYSLPQAIDAVVREGAQPMAGEFSRAIIESRLGVPIEDALENIANRMDSEDFRWVVMAIRIQREVGGNLAEVLSTVAQTMRERERVRRQIRVLSAEGRLSAWVLGGLPPAFLSYLLLVRPHYVKPLFTDKIGIAMLLTVGTVFVGGIFWLRKVVEVEV